MAVGGVVGHPVGGYQAQTTVEVKQAGGRLLVKLGLSQLVSCILPGGGYCTRSNAFPVLRGKMPDWEIHAG